MTERKVKKYPLMLGISLAITCGAVESASSQNDISQEEGQRYVRHVTPPLDILVDLNEGETSYQDAKIIYNNLLIDAPDFDTEEENWLAKWLSNSYDSMSFAVIADSGRMIERGLFVQIRDRGEVQISYLDLSLDGNVDAFYVGEDIFLRKDILTLGPDSMEPFDYSYRDALQTILVMYAFDMWNNNE